jgi:hypothetical protein
VDSQRVGQQKNAENAGANPAQQSAKQSHSMEQATRPDHELILRPVDARRAGFGAPTRRISSQVYSNLDR